MARPEFKVGVTDHALLRWRERGALYADDGVRVVLAAFREAVDIRREDLPSGITAAADRSYRYHAGFGVYFVARFSNNALKLVTVFTDPTAEAALYRTVEGASGFSRGRRFKGRDRRRY